MLGILLEQQPHITHTHKHTHTVTSLNPTHFSDFSTDITPSGCFAQLPSSPYAYTRFAF